MLKRKLMFLAAIVIVFSLYTQQARAQSDDRKVEIGGQFSILRVPSVTANVCADLCPPSFFTGDSSTEVGFGPRIGFNATSYLTLEAEMNFFPRDRDSEGGRKVQGLFGAKAGKRFKKAGIFAKARPGFVRFTRGDYQFGTVGFQPVGKTNFAIDIGGVAELYPSRNTIIRFDAGDTIIRFGPRNVAAASTTFPGLIVVFLAAETKHNLQVGVGFGFRF